MNAENENWLTAKGWTLRENRFDVRYQGKCESVMHLSNGFVGVRAALEEDYPLQTRGTFVAGVYDGAEGEPRELANAADMLRLELQLSGQRFSMQDGKTTAYSRALDMRTGELTRELIWQAPGGGAYRLSFHRFVSEADRGVIGQRLRITPLDGADAIRISTGIDARMSNTGTQHFRDGVKRVFDGKYMLLEQVTLDARYRLAHGCACRLSGGGEHRGGYAIKRRVLEQTLTASVERGETLCFEKLCVITRSGVSCPRERDGDFGAALDRLRALCEAGYDAALSAHRREVLRFWDDREIRVEADDPFITAATRYAQHALRSLLPADSHSSIGAKGLSGEGYKGHVFWDVDTFMLPYYLYHKPQEARRLLQYRVDRLSQAMNNARMRGYSGLMFPWESADTGYDETPAFGQIDIVTGKANPVMSGIKEYHITADIALAAWQYWRATGDYDFMREGGTSVVVGAALFWASYATWNERLGRYEILDVVGPDEYTECVDNNAYTNYMAHAVIGYACELLDMAGADGVSDMERRFCQTGLKELLCRVRELLYLPVPGADGVIPQSDGFLQGKSIDITPYCNDLIRQSILTHYTRAQVNRMQVLKQADVVMLLALFPHLFDTKTQEANWRYYEPRTLHDSSLSRAIYALVAYRLGMLNEAYGCMLEGMRIDIGDNPHSSNDGIHAASLGGVWMDVVMGVCGVRLGTDMPYIDPALPGGIRGVNMSFYWRGRKLYLSVDRGAISLRADGDEPVALRVLGKKVTLRGCLTIEYGGSDGRPE